MEVVLYLLFHAQETNVSGFAVLGLSNNMMMPPSQRHSSSLVPKTRQQLGTTVSYTARGQHVDKYLDHVSWKVLDLSSKPTNCQRLQTKIENSNNNEALHNHSSDPRPLRLVRLGLGMS
jgi:hypothetical protein